LATVITNLLSAIPIFGQDIVELIWGGLNTDEPQYGDVLLKILLNAGNSPNLGLAYDLFLVIISIIYVKIARTWRKSAGVRSISTSEASQRLDAGDLTYAYLVGLFEGDGFFSITKNGKYLTYVLGIELSIRDVQLIYKIKNLLGVGVVSFRKRDNIEMVTLRIRNKDDLKKFIIPIFDKYPMFSNKQYDYLRFKNALLSGIIYSSDLPEYSRSNESLNTVESIINTSYFPA
jgi:ubiquinol-cytochrome c reductase cytochrome b subunit